MKEVKTIVDRVISSLNSYADKKRITQAQQSYPTQLQIIGVYVPNERKVLAELQLELKDADFQKIIEIAKALVATNIFECQHVAHKLLDKNKKVLKSCNYQDLIDLQGILDNWASVDSFACLVAGVLWRENIIEDSVVLDWLNSDNVWMRRTAIVCTIALNQKARGGKGDTARTIMLCEKMVSDHNDMIVKAMSWALRVLISTDRQAVEMFLEIHNDKLHNRIIREVTSKLTTGKKNM